MQPSRPRKPCWQCVATLLDLFQNTLVFLAIDQIRLQDLDEAVRRYLAWESIVTDAESGALELTTHQIKQAKEQKDTADGIVAARLPEAYQWLLVPTAGVAAERASTGRRFGCLVKIPRGSSEQETAE